MNDITVVITSFRRPTRVIRAFDSCVKAGVQHIVVSCSGLNPEMEKVHQIMTGKNGDTIIDAIADDLGCNEMWLRGVMRAKTEWVHILHDDDALEPDFLSVKPLLNGCGFAMWKSVQKDDQDHTNEIYSNLGDAPEGKYSSIKLIPKLMDRGQLSISPVTGIFRKSDLVCALSEFGRLNSKEFEIKPGMSIGNDLLIWLRAVERHQDFLWFPKVLTRFGYWPGSTTCEFQKQLPVFYDKIRDHFSKNPRSLDGAFRGLSPVFPTPKIVHCVEYHLGDDQEEIRKRPARESWKKLYQSQALVPAIYSEYHRDSSCVGDSRMLPFLKDLLAYGVSKCFSDRDIVLLTNDDTIIHEDLPNCLREILSKQDATMSHRCEYKTFDDQYTGLFIQGKDHGGRDLFAFKVCWLRKYWNDIPDFVLGAPLWDLILAALIRKALGGNKNTNVDGRGMTYDWEIPIGYIAHIEHDHFWNGKHPADKYNHMLAERLGKLLHPAHPWDDLLKL